MKDLSTGRARRGDDSVGQLTRLDGTTDIDTVLLTVGGNDVGFIGKITACYVGDCLRDLDKLDRDLTDLKTSLISAYNLVVDASSGDLVVRRLPRHHPRTEQGLSQLRLDYRCREVRLYYLEDALERTLAAAAEAADVDYIAIRDALSGHELCTPDSWINPIRAVGGTLRGQPQHARPTSDGDKVQAGLDELYREDAPA